MPRTPADNRAGDDQGAFRRLADGLPQGLLVHRDLEPIYANMSAATLFGFDDPAALLSAGPIDGLFDADALARLDADAASPNACVDARRRDGMPIKIEARVTPIAWDGGDATCLSLLDVTEREAANAVLRASEATYRRLFENVPDGIFRIAENRKVLETNPSLAAMLGYESPEAFKAELRKSDGNVFVEPDGWDKVVEQLKQDGTVRDYQAQWRCRDGRPIWVSLKVAAVPGIDGGASVFEGSVTEITAQRDAAMSLLHAKEAAELANRAKSEFLAHMSHELRTPLNCVIGFSQILMNEMFGPIGRDSYREYATDINTAGNHLLGLISDILDISKIEAGELEIFETPVDVGALLVHCMTMMRDRSDNAGVTLAVEFDHDLPILSADELRIRQIVLNLLSNAVKFTPANGRVRISASVTDDLGIVLRVADTGVGIAPEDIERVLAPFEQVRLAPTLAHEGTGLGLYLAKTLTEMHDGRLEIESTLGKGTEVSVFMPPERIVVAPDGG